MFNSVEILLLKTAIEKELKKLATTLNRSTNKTKKEIVREVMQEYQDLLNKIEKMDS